jgi:hypothetical protein
MNDKEDEFKLDDFKKVARAQWPGFLGRKGYKLNEWLIYLGLLPAFVLLVIVFSKYGYSDQVYYHCDQPKCTNPFYVCNTDFSHVVYTNCLSSDKKVPEVFLPYTSVELFDEGFTLGEKPPWELELAGWLVVIGPLVMLFVNHFLYNRRYDWKRMFGEKKDE